MKQELLRFNGAVEWDPAIDAWMMQHAGELGAIAGAPHGVFACGGLESSVNLMNRFRND